MIYSNDSIRYMNVVSAKYRIHYQDQETALREFLETLNDSFTVKGPLFYALHNVPMDGTIHMEYFMPVVEERGNIMIDSSYRFHSYYGIEDMISYCMKGDPAFETEIAYRLLLDYMEQNGLDQATPFFHVFSGDRSLPYSFVKVGVRGKVDS